MKDFAKFAIVSIASGCIGAAILYVAIMWMLVGAFAH